VKTPWCHRWERFLQAGLAALVLLSAAPLGAALADEPLATDHWAYETIYELYAAGVWGRWPIGTRPWYRGDIQERLVEIQESRGADGHALTPHQSWLVARLQSEFDEHFAVDPAAGTLEYRIGARPGVNGRLDRYDDPLLRSRLAVFAGVGQGPWWVRVRGDLDSHGDLDPTFFGRKWKGNLTGTIDLAAFSYRRGGLEVLVGRDFIRWGSGSHDVLLLNDQSPPFDLARFGFHHKFFDFHYFVTGLDRNFASPGDSSAWVAPDVKRYMAGHRLEVRPWRTLEVGFSEVVIWGGPERQLEAFYLNPFLPFYWEQLNAGEDDNPLWSMDASYVFPGGPMLYGELLIDDFQIDFSSEPQQIGGMLGMNWADFATLSGSFLTVEWTRVQQTVFGQNRPYNRYLNHRVGMGTVLGPDADRWYVQWRQHLTRALDLSGRFTRQRDGEREIDTPQGNAVPYGEHFPSGIPVVSTFTELRALYQPDAHLRIELYGGYRWERDSGHVDGATHDGGFVGLACELSGWRVGRF
jgi:hypothetical protein